MVGKVCRGVERAVVSHAFILLLSCYRLTLLACVEGLELLIAIRRVKLLISVTLDHSVVEERVLNLRQGLYIC